MRRPASFLIVAIVLLAVGQASAVGSYSWPSDAPYSVSKSKMNRALECKRGNHVSEHAAGP